MKSKKIETIRKRFKKEWLLIAVDKMDESTTTPVSGHLIAHSPNRDDIYKKSITHKGLALIDYSEDALPKKYGSDLLEPWSNPLLA